MKIHLDLDCFFAAAHRIGNPKLHNIPIAVGGKSNVSIFDKEKHQKSLSQINGAFSSSILNEEKSDSFQEYFVDQNGKIRGIVTTASYEARSYGVKTAMPVAQALRLCPTLKMIPPNYPLYHKLSKQLKTLLEKEIPIIEQFSIDEFFGDLDGWIEEKDAYDFALYLQNKIKKELQLPISIGLARSKWIAKLATTDAKPIGVKFVRDEDLDAYVNPKLLKEFPGIGQILQNKLHGYGIQTLKDLKERKELLYSWGKNEKQIYDRVCGNDNEKVDIKSDKKSIGLGRSFDPIKDRDEIRRRVVILCRHLAFIAYKDKIQPTNYALKIKYQYGETNNVTVNTNRVFSELHLKEEISKLLKKVDIHPSHQIVQIGITLGGFNNKNQKTFDLFSFEDDTKQSKLSNSMQNLRDKFGIDIIKSGSEL
jgi:DNA polymerase-4